MRAFLCVVACLSVFHGSLSHAERFLVSESWCIHCPAAKARFLSAGGRPENVITIEEARNRFGMQVRSVPFEFETSTVAASPVRQRLPVVQTQWGTIDLETYNRNCNCPMCQGIRQMQAAYRQQYASAPIVPEKKPPPSMPKEVAVKEDPGQLPTPMPVVHALVNELQLSSEDLLADLGCGDGRILITAVKRTGCRAIGVEIDPRKADEARAAVNAAGLSSRIEIVTGDARAFDLSANKVTAVAAYLYPELLAELAESLKTVPVVVTPYHRVPGLEMTRQGDLWISRI